MFGRKKRINEEKQFLAMINYLLDDDTVAPKELQALEKAKKRIEKDEYYPRILQGLMNNLRPMALHSELSKHVGE
jgi:hypothetical protein